MTTQAALFYRPTKKQTKVIEIDSLFSTFIRFYSLCGAMPVVMAVVFSSFFSSLRTKIQMKNGQIQMT